MTADDKFFAWLDGELDGAEAAEVAARVAGDPELSALAEQHRAMQARLKGAFDSVAAAPVPRRLEELASSQTSTVVDFASRRPRARPGPSPLPQWAMMAATLVLGLFVGTLVPGGGTQSPVRMQGGAIYATAGLQKALDSELASAPSDGPVRVALTFRDRSGSVCRSFTGGEASGLACRDGERWKLRGLFPAGEGQGGDGYRMAAGMDPALAALIDSTLEGEPMDAAQESEAKARGWR
jgi:hypothetical protein